MLSYSHLISTINGDSGSVSSKYQEIVDAKVKFFIEMFILTPLIGVAMWAILIERILIGMSILAFMYALSMVFGLMMVKGNKKMRDIFEKYWIPQDICYIFLNYKFKLVVILISLLLGAEMFFLVVFVIHMSHMMIIILVLLSIGMGPFLIFMNTLNCKNGVSIVHVVKFDTPGTIANMIARELNTEAKKIMGNSTFRIDLPQSGQSLTIYRMEKNKDKVWLTISNVTEKNVYQTKGVVDKINAVLEKI